MRPDQGMIFLCGPSRSGTALVRSMLNQNPRIHLAGETHYFDDLRVRLDGSKERKLSAEEQRLACDYFCALTHRPYGLSGDPDQGWLSRSLLTECAQQMGGTADDYFTAFCRLSADRAEAVIAGEKTPRHVFRIADIFEALPTARAICMIRDPRAVVASYRDWKNQGGLGAENDEALRASVAADEARARASYHPATISMLWRAQANAAARAEARFGPERVKLVRYEDLVADPETVMGDICAWLALDYEPEMLQVPMHNSSYARFNKAQGISREARDRWVKLLGPSEIRLIERVCGRLMQKFDYAAVQPRGDRVRESLLWLSWPRSVFSALHANRKRTGNIAGYVLRRLRLAAQRA